MEVYLIRHAESTANLKRDVICGRSNAVPLSEEGKRQAYLLGKRLQQEGIQFDKVYSSPAIRARETAQVVCSLLGLPITICPELVEKSQGDWEGKQRNTVYTDDLLEEMNQDPWTFRPPHGESQEDAAERYWQWLQGIQAEKVAVFGHSMAIKCLLRKIMEFNPLITHQIGVDNASLTILRVSEGFAVPVRINDAAHLAKSFG